MRKWLEARNLEEVRTSELFRTFQDLVAARVGKMPALSEESYDAQNAAGGSANVYGDGPLMQITNAASRRVTM